MIARSDFLHRANLDTLRNLIHIRANMVHERLGQPTGSTNRSRSALRSLGMTFTSIFSLIDCDEGNILREWSNEAQSK